MAYGYGYNNPANYYMQREQRMDDWIRQIMSMIMANKQWKEQQRWKEKEWALREKQYGLQERQTKSLEE